MRTPFFTIGHSDRSLEEFTGLLAESDIHLLVDVRRIPGSNRHPQFNEDELKASLEVTGVVYLREQGLTGRRPVSRSVADEVNGWWRNRSFHNYADHALSDEFRQSLEKLLALGDEDRSAVMCSEAVWWRCHRRIIADHLIARDRQVLHVMSPGRIEPASLSEGATVREDLSVIYPGGEPSTGSAVTAAGEPST